MRIILYSYNYYPEPIGIAPLMTELAEGLVRRGHEVRVITAMPWYPEGEISPAYRDKLYYSEERNGVKIQRCYVWTRSSRNFLNRVLFEVSFITLSFVQALNGWRPDMIFLTIPGLPVSIPAAILAWWYRVPIILNLQDILPDAAMHVGLIRNENLIKVFKWLEKFAYEQATLITVIADGFTKNLLEKGVPVEKLVEIPNWVDVNFIQPLSIDNTDNYFRKENNLLGKFIVLYSGNIALTQGIETVIKAAKYVDNPAIQLVIVGEKKALESLQKRCTQEEVNNVLLLPFQPREKLPEMLSAADVALVMQKKNVIAFNMPSKIQVLLASGKAIIASVPSDGTAAAAIKKSGGGVVVPPEDPKSLAKAIMEMYENRELITTFGTQGRNYAEQHYSFDLIMDKYEQMFKSI